MNINSNIFLSIYRVGSYRKMFEESSISFKRVSSYLSCNKKIEEGQSFVPLDIFESLLLSLPESKNELLIVKEISKAIRIFDLGTLGYYLYSCDNITEAIKSYVCFGMLISDFIHYDIYKEGNGFYWEARYDEAEEVMSERSYRLFLTLESAIRHSLVCKLLGEEIDCVIRKKKLVYYFGNDDLLLTSGNRKLNKELEKILVDFLLEKEELIDLVKIFIKKNISSEKISIKKLAVFLNVSNRSVQRYLKKENTSYKELLTEVRKELVEIYLQQKIPMKKIALRLGYNDVGSFFRAFKSWYGCSTQNFLVSY